MVFESSDVLALSIPTVGAVVMAVSVASRAASKGDGQVLPCDTRECQLAGIWLVACETSWFREGGRAY